MTNSSQLDFMKSAHLHSSFLFKGVVDSVNDIKKFKAKDGDVIFVSSTNETYCYLENKWIVISDSDNTQDIKPQETTTEILNVKCTNCGAPLIRYNKSSSVVKCEYCGSIFDIKIFNT